MGYAISRESRRELIEAVGDRYRTGGRAEKRRILDEFVAVTGWHRKHAIRALNRHGVAVSDRSVRVPRLYDEAVRQALLILWEASDRVCSKRLKPLIPTMLDALERHGHLKVADDVRPRLLAVSAATIDRILAAPRAIARGAMPRRSRGAKSVRHRVPVRTFADWTDPTPGWMEADLVCHCGSSMEGAFVSTLVLTDVASTWTECTPLIARDAGIVTEALDRLRESMPFPLLGLDTDNVLNASTPPAVFDSIPREAAVAAPRALWRRGRETPRGLPPRPVTSLTIVDTRSGSRSSRSSQSFKQRKAPVEGPNIIYEVDFASTARARGIDPLGSSSSRKRRYDASVLISA